MESMMRNIFLYAHSESAAFLQVSKKLDQHLNSGNLSTLSCGSFYGSNASQKLRNDDIVILYASTSEELKKLCKNMTDFAGYNIILILQHTINDPYRDALQLSPRFINLGEPNILELQEVIQKISEKPTYTLFNKHQHTI